MDIGRLERKQHMASPSSRLLITYKRSRTEKEKEESPNLQKHLLNIDNMFFMYPVFQGHIATNHSK